MAFEGSERRILHAILREQGEALAGYVDDSKIAQIADLCITDVRDCLETLEEKECVQRSLGVGGQSAYITAKGRQELRRSPVISGEKRAESPLKIVPKGLRSFDEHDADFFLDLLPGPRRSDGLPESIHFWKLRIEEMDPDKTFRVGYIFGPSGCGKSSLVKAGLLPRLSKHIIPIYIEATGEDTEARLLRGLRKQYPDLPADRDLLTALVAAREKTREGSNKILLVIDQFEQWYHSRGAETGTELANALSECDGGRVQAIILVRDDYSMALHRFMAAIGVRQNQDQNFAVVDLFDLEHARKVLTAFGRGYGKLPDNPKEMTAAQNEFLDRTITGLSQEGRVISVRLALFAEMLKGKPWTPETLKQVGGAEGVGVTFLEETFSARTAPPSYRTHQKAAQAVLRALLPETGSNIKGNMQSYDKLLLVSGYSSRPNQFDELLHTLNSELRLISPIEPEGSESDGQTNTQVGEKFFLLTHDYLVPSIREWLTRKQKETRRGRAEIRLGDRSAIWAAKNENRQLPSLLEWVNIRLLTSRKDWTKPQTRMMKRAGRVHGLRTVGLATLAALITWGGIEGYGNDRASSLVESLKTANTKDVEPIIDQLLGYRRWAKSRLVRLLGESEKTGRDHLNASLALLPMDASQAGYLYDRLLNSDPIELPVIWKLMRENHQAPVDKLWRQLDDPQTDTDQRFRAACALALVDAAADTQRWDAVSRFVTDRLLASIIKNPSHYSSLIETLRPVRARLVAPLSRTFRDQGKLESVRTLATSILTDYATDRPAVLADLLMDAAPPQFAILFPQAQAVASQALPVLESELVRKPTREAKEDDKDKLAQRQARAAVALVRLGRTEKVWPLLRHCADPRLRSFIVNWLSPLGGDPAILAAELDGIDPNASPTPAQAQQLMDAVLFQPETSMRRALILALGAYSTEGLSSGERELLIGKLLALYRNDPDSGIHGAAEWTLRQWKQQEKLLAADAALMKRKDRGDRRWLVNSQGQTFALIEGPVEFTMGSPQAEPGRDSDEVSHRRLIPRRFAIAAKEVSFSQYQEFVRENSQFGLERGYLDTYSPDPGASMIAVTWFGAVAYCNWLSKREGLPEDQWCYLRNKKGEYDQEMTIPADVLKRIGYRLPTEAEWEYACRAGAITSRYYGLSVDLLAKYARYTGNSAEHAWPAGSLLPNDLGLFDMLGNVYEWCDERDHQYQTKGDRVNTDAIDMSDQVDMTHRLHRGAAFLYPPKNVRSAQRARFVPANRDVNSGLRLAMTYE